VGGGGGGGGGESVVYVCVRAMGWSILGLCQTVVNREKKISPTFVSSFTCKYHRQPRFDSIRLGFDYITSAYPRTFFFRHKPAEWTTTRQGWRSSKMSAISMLSQPNPATKAFHPPFDRSPTPSQTTKVFTVMLMTMVKGREGKARWKTDVQPQPT
jgi:hypothetical protein